MFNVHYTTNKDFDQICMYLYFLFLSNTNRSQEISTYVQTQKNVSKTSRTDFSMYFIRN